MNGDIIVLIFLICVYFLPFPIACIYALVKKVNIYLIIAPLIISVIFPLNLFIFGVNESLYYLLGCFIMIIVGGIGLYCGYARHMYHYGEAEKGMSALRCFVYCLPIILFPFITAGVFCWAVHKLPKPSEVVKAKRPEVGRRPSWGEVVKEREEEEEGGA